MNHPWRLRRLRRFQRLGTLLAIGASLSLASAGCGRSGHVDSGRTNARVDLTWTLRPATPSVGPATLILSVRAPSGKPITKATVRIEGHMTHAGMAPLIAAAIERAPGVYEAAFSFTMQGDWALLVSIVLPDGTRVERRIDVANVRSSG